MAKKKDTQVQAESPPETPPQEAAAATERPPEHQQPEPPPQTNGRQQRTPDVVYSLQSDRTTNVEVEVFVTPCVSQQGIGYEQVTTVASRHFLGNDGRWVRHNVWRTHDIPVLLFLLQKAHSWALERRTKDSSMPF